MDQMAALHWVQQNINRFGGDPNAVTLAGHGSGAACINFLMTSPTMVPGLFHRAILLSGSAFSSWALVEDPVMYALKLAKEVNCSIPEDLIKNHEQIVDCLREVPLDDLYAADIQAPSFLTAFGPSVSGAFLFRKRHKFDTMVCNHAFAVVCRWMALSFGRDYQIRTWTMGQCEHRSDRKTQPDDTICCSAL